MFDSLHFLRDFYLIPVSSTERKNTRLLKRPHSVCKGCFLLFVSGIKSASNLSHLGKREALSCAVGGETEEPVPRCQRVQGLHCLPPWLILPGTVSEAGFTLAKIFLRLSEGKMTMKLFTDVCVKRVLLSTILGTREIKETDL